MGIHNKLGDRLTGPQRNIYNRIEYYKSTQHSLEMTVIILFCLKQANVKLSRTDQLSH